MAAEATALRPKQQHPRWQIPASRPVRVELGPAGAGNLIEISAGGMRIRSLAPMRRGAEIPIRIQIPDRPDVVRCYGIVVWSSSSSGATGVRFVNIPDSDKQLLATWLTELQKATKGPEELDLKREGERALKQIHAQKLNNADALNVIARAAMEIAGGSGAMIALGSQMNMTCMASAGAGMEVGSRVMSNGGITGECTRSRKVVHCANAENDPRVNRELKVGSMIALPLLITGELRGVMEVFANKPFSFTPKIIDGLQSLADAVLKIAFAGPQAPESAERKPAQEFASTKPQVEPTPISSPTAPIPLIPAKASEAVDMKPAAEFAVMKSQPSPRMVNQPIVAIPVTPITPVTAAKAEVKPVATTASMSVPKSLSAPIVPMPLAPKPRSAEKQIVPSTPAGQDPKLEPLAAAITPAIPLQSATGKQKPTYVLELPDDEGFDPTGKMAVRTLFAEPESYSPPSSNRKWIFAVPIAAALIAVPFWYLRQQKAEPEVVAAASSPAEVTPTATEPVIEVRPTEPAAPVQAHHQEKDISQKTVEKTQVKVPQHDVKEKTTIAAEKAEPEPEPIVLAAASSVTPKRAADFDSAPTVAPNVAVSAVSVPAVPLPASATVPKLQAPVTTGGALVKRVAPVYPANARTMHVEGEVELLIQVNKDGTVGKIRTKKGNPLLAFAAAEAVKQWRYEPLRVNGTPKETEKTIQLNFVMPR